MSHRSPLAAIALVAGLAAVAAPVSAQQKNLPPKQGWGVNTRKPEPEARPRDRDDRRPHRGRTGAGYYEGYRDGYWDAASRRAYGTPLEARLFAPLQQRLHFSLNDVAYVAVFEIQPGRGVRLLFPSGANPEQKLAGGAHEPPIPADVAVGPFGGTTPSPAGATRWLYLVASDTPLGLLPARRAPAQLEALIGQAAARGSSPAHVAQLLRQHVVTLGAAGTWSDALVSYVPGSGAGTTAQVRCSNGVVYAVQAGATFECPR